MTLLAYTTNIFPSWWAFSVACRDPSVTCSITFRQIDATRRGIESIWQSATFALVFLIRSLKEKNTVYFTSSQIDPMISYMCIVASI